MGISVLDELRSHPCHWKSLGAGGGFAAIRCIDCGFKAEGGYREVVEKWNEHLPSPRRTPTGDGGTR